MNPAEIPVVELVPHGPEICLIHELASSTDEETVAVVEVRPGIPFHAGSGVPSYVGLEYMAQTIAARMGVEQRREGEAPLIGYLLGTRHYRCAVDYFTDGSSLRITVRPSFVDGQFGAFDCSISCDGVLAECTLNTYQVERRAAERGEQNGT